MSSLHMFEERLEKSIKDADKVIILPHLYPDFDAIGSSIGLSVLASFFGKESYILIDDLETSINEKVLNIIKKNAGN